MDASPDVVAPADLRDFQPDGGWSEEDASEMPADLSTSTEDALSGDVELDSTTAPEDPWIEVYAAIEAKRAEADLPGLAVAVTRPGEVLWTGAFGFANLETQLKATTDTPFMLASVSKTMTAAALMHAWEAGAFGFDDDINSHLPFKVDNPLVEDETISLRHLVTHTSGIQDNWGEMPYLEGDSTQSFGDYLKDYLTPEGARYNATKNFYELMPGTERNYGNIATALAGFVLESATQTRFDAYCEEHIFEVLSMENTGWHLADFDPATVAMPYRYNEGAYEAIGHYGYGDYPSGQLRCSVSDLARFLAAVSNQGKIGDAQFLQPETVAEMFSSQISYLDPGQKVFWYEANVSGREVIAHSGGDKGVATEMVYSAQTGVGVIVLSNTSWDSLSGFYSSIVDILFDQGEALQGLR